jgi:germination protein M
MKRTPISPRSRKPVQSPKDKRPNSLTGLIILVLILGLVSAILIFKEPLRNLALHNEGSPAPSGALSGQHAVNGKPLSPVPGTTPNPNASGPDSKGVIVVEGGSANSLPLATSAVGPTPNSQINQIHAQTSDDNSQGPLKPAQLYWIQVSDDSAIHLEKVARSLHLGDSPMSAAIRSLLRGPGADDLNRGLLSLVPKGTQLLSAYVQNRTAFLNFSDEFQFNPMGSDGYKGQLRQIVYTATEFDTVDNVQILINGKRLQYLGGEGVFIGQPLARSSF